MIKLLPGRSEHFDRIKIDESSMFFSKPGLRNAVVKHPAYTLFHNDDIILISGVVVPFCGVGEAWLIADTELIKKYKLSAYRAVKNGLDMIITHKKLRRVQATVKQGYEAGIRFIEHLGFKSEGIMPLYDPDGSTHIRYARLTRLPLRGMSGQGG
jgi:hypothetical protein